MLIAKSVASQYRQNRAEWHLHVYNADMRLFATMLLWPMPFA
jgi:hypothetical protein